MLVILPWALPTIVNAMMWRLNFNPDYGSVNALLSQLGLIDSYRSWLGSPDSALHAVMLADIWKNYPLVTLLVLAALQSVPDDLYEAARLDGASAGGVFAPLPFRPLWVPWRRAGATHHRCLQSVRHYLCYDPRRPARQYQNVELFVYQESFSYLRAGSGAAYAMLMSLMCAVLIALYLFLLLRQRRRSVDDEA